MADPKVSPSEQSASRVELTVEVVMRKEITVGFVGRRSMKEVWAEREALMAPHIPPGWTVARYSAESRVQTRTETGT